MLICRNEFFFVKSIAETLFSLSYLLLHLVFHLGHIVLDQHIGAVTALCVFVVYQRIVERIHMSRSLPRGRVHEYGGIQTYDVFVHLNHGLPPVFLYVVFHLATVGAVIVHRAKAVVYLARRENKPVFFGVSHYFFEQIVILCHGIS